jgi:hypothetical protein
LVYDQKYFSHPFGILAKERLLINGSGRMMIVKYYKPVICSGLAWEENHSTICDATKMLFQANMGRVQPEKPVALNPTRIGIIPLGTTNLLRLYFEKSV